MMKMMKNLENIILIEDTINQNQVMMITRNPVQIVEVNRRIMKLLQAMHQNIQKVKVTTKVQMQPAEMLPNHKMNQAKMKKVKMKI